MSKKFSKILLTLLLIVVIIASFSVCFAKEENKNTAELTTETDAEKEDASSGNEEIYNGDLYLFDNNVVMDKLVDGNVFICGQNVEIKGQVNGNLFVCANKITFDNCYVRYSVFAAGNSIYYNGACNDLYVASNNLEMTYDSYVVRDVKAAASDVIFKAAIGRDVDLTCGNVNFGEDKNIPIIYGNLRYSAPKEATIPEGVITENGSVNYNQQSKSSDKDVSSVTDIIVGFLTCIATVLIIYAITRKFTPSFAEKLSNEKLSALKLLKAFGIGLASLIITAILFILLLMLTVGVKLAFILALLYVVLCLVSVPVLTIIITNILKPILKIEKTPMFLLILVLVSIILYGVTLIPVVGGILGFVIKITSLGLLINIYIPHKELSDEEKIAIQEAKEQAKADKEKKKQEKISIKEAKKQAKADDKKSKKNEN